MDRSNLGMSSLEFLILLHRITHLDLVTFRQCADCRSVARWLIIPTNYVYQLANVTALLPSHHMPGLQKDLHMSDYDFSMALTVLYM
jgi:hypothetical protein